jgi:hypothetical protein
MFHHGPFDVAQDRPFDLAQDRPFDLAQDRPFDLAQDRPFDVAQDGPFDVVQDRHCRCALDARTAQQLQQHGFRLVVGMVRQRDEISGMPGQGRVAQLARGRFDAVIIAQRRDVHAFDLQRDAVSRAKLDAEIRPGVGIGADAVMDVQGGKAPFEAWREEMQQVQQHDRIHAAAQADEDAAVPGKKRREARRNGVS